MCSSPYFPGTMFELFYSIDLAKKLLLPINSYVRMSIGNIEK